MTLENGWELEPDNAKNTLEPNRMRGVTSRLISHVLKTSWAPYVCCGSVK